MRFSTRYGQLPRRLGLTFLLISLIAVPNVCGDDSYWTGDLSDDFFTAGNWDSGVPATEDDIAFIQGGNNLPAVIGAGAGEFTLGAIKLGFDFDADGGSVVQNGGTLILAADVVGEESVIGDSAPTDSSWIMNNDAVMLYDDPLGGDGAGLDTDGTGKDFDVGKSVPDGAVGRMELHNNAILRISDDLKIADGTAGNGIVVVDGDAQITVGSGVSSSGVSQITVAGNALFLSGNSAGPGNTQQGRTNEGYLTLSTGGSEESILDISENGRVYVRTLQQRDGISTITIRDNGQFHVFDAFEYSEPNLGVATVVGSAQGPQRTSQVSQNPTAETIIQLFDNAVMTIDSDLEDSGFSGLAVSGGNNTGANTAGGLTTIEINDQATFRVQQDLNLTLGNGETAESTFSVKGPDATVTIGGDLRMALDELGDPNPGIAVLQAVITSGSHSTITVGGTALIENGDLTVVLDGYVPTGGEIYELISAGSVAGTEFRDISLPSLAEGLSWDLVIGTDGVDLRVLPPLLPGDYDKNGMLDAGDLDLQALQIVDPTPDLSYDLNGDNLVNFTDREIWVNDLKNSWIGDANLNGEFNSGDMVQVFARGLYETGNPAGWEDGDFNGDTVFGSGDMVAAFVAGGYEQGLRPNGPNPAVSAVPEPHTLGLLAAGLVMLAALTRRR